MRRGGEHRRGEGSETFLERKWVLRRSVCDFVASDIGAVVVPRSHCHKLALEISSLSRTVPLSEAVRQTERDGERERERRKKERKKI